MHYVFVGKPCHKLHKEESGYNNKNLDYKHYATWASLTKSGKSDTYL
jgi:hypothetical protein